jgi:acyl-CoA reductase-like NAD-dependent aldehyde dehydrogenase
VKTLQSSYPYYLNNKAVYANEDLEVTDKYSGEVATRCALADAQAINDGIAGAARASEPMANMASFEKKAVLEHCVTRFTQRFDELAMALCIEAGKPINDAEGEVTRLIDTFRIAAEESTRMHGAMQALDISPRAKGYRGMWKRVPIGPCSFISPFNFPLNLAAHKIAPALAVGCPFVMKPASRTPLGAIIMGEILAETDLPEGSFSILPCSRDGADLFTVDDRLKLLSFTGSPAVGWDLKARCGKKKIVLELGGNAAVVVDADTQNLDDAVDRIIFGAFYQSGQSCIGVQRIMIHEDIYEIVKQKLVAKSATLIKGDPKLRDTFIGPMISVGEASRLHGWIEAAAAAGGKILCGGTRDGAMLDATLMENVPLDQDLCVEEAFGPAAVLQKFSTWNEAISMVNDSKFGLQAGIFTRDFYKVQQAWDQMEVGGVVVGDVPSYRVDNMPYGGVKDSGIGREGIVFAMEDMTEIRNLVIRTPPH